ncbi:MAG: glycosyltransferase family 4 protein [Candidatus Paceibacterota bacterium]
MVNKPSRLLITTQVVDRTDPFLGFFHGWLAELATHFEHIHVICLKEGEHSLPANVTVHTLGKERGRSRAGYIFSSLAYAWQLRREYDVVFVHMNQEYILVAGWLWKLLQKPIYLWRNHYAGGILTDLSAFFAKKVFCTSRFSYTAKYKKTVLMPIGVDTELFTPNPSLRTPRSVLFFSRFAPVKRPDMLLEALGILYREEIRFQASFYGTALPHHAEYRERTVRRAEEIAPHCVTFHEGVPHSEARAIFNAHEIFVNLSASGTYDKTMFEAAASGCVVVAASEDFASIAGSRFHVAENAHSVVVALRELLALSPEERSNIASRFRDTLIAGQSLKSLAMRLEQELAS